MRYVASEVRETPDYLLFDILMEHCAGGPAAGKLKELQETGRRVPEATLMRWLHDVCAALNHLHSQSPPIAHRDLKAENMLLGADGTVKLCDFGSATSRAGVYESYAVSALFHRDCQLIALLRLLGPVFCDFGCGFVTSRL